MTDDVRRNMSESLLLNIFLGTYSLIDHMGLFRKKFLKTMTRKHASTQAVAYLLITGSILITSLQSYVKKVV